MPLPIVMFEADSNVIRNSVITGPSLTAGVGIVVIDNPANGNLFEKDTVRNSGYGIEIIENTNASPVGNEVRECYIEAVCGIYLGSRTARIHDNDIQPIYPSTTSAPPVIGVRASPTDTAYVYNNRIHNFRGLQCEGIEAIARDSGLVMAYNNFIYDWNNALGVMGILADGPGRAECSYNGICIDDTSSMSFSAAVWVMGGQVSLLNNILKVDGLSCTCMSIYYAGGILTSDHNCFDGSGSPYSVGYLYSGDTYYTTLPEWVAGTSQDQYSRQGNPNFVSSSDLHIDPMSDFVDGAGTPIPGITTDIDGDPRAEASDIGADEYDVFHVSGLVIHVNWDVNGVDLAWRPVAGANSYRIYRTDPATYSTYPTILVATTGDTTFTHSGILSTAQHLIYGVTASSVAP
jgi:hypothetical protein